MVNEESRKNNWKCWSWKNIVIHSHQHFIYLKRLNRIPLCQQKKRKMEKYWSSSVRYIFISFISSFSHLIIIITLVISSSGISLNRLRRTASNGRRGEMKSCTEEAIQKLNKSWEEKAFNLLQYLYALKEQFAPLSKSLR